MNIRKLFIAGALALLPVTSSAAFAESVLRVVPLNELKILDPIWTTAYATRDHGYMVYDTLLGMDENFKPRPQMAESWTVSDDKLTWTFVLREGLKWHDGTAVTAEDCVASLRRWAARDTQGQILAKLWKSLDATDARTITMRLSEPFGMMLETLAKQSSIPTFMMPKHIAETDPFEAIKDPIGSGPFMFKQDEWVLGSKAVYVKNPNYVPRNEPPSGTSGGKIAKVDRIELVNLPDAGTALNALQTGEVDYWLQPLIDLLPILKANPEIEVKTNDPIGWLAFLRLNHVSAPTDKKLVRQAILAAVNQDDFMTSIVGDKSYYKKCFSVFPCGSPWTNDAGNDLASAGSIDKAKALLKQSGYNGEKLVILHATDSSNNNSLGLMVGETLRKIGMNVELQAMDYQTLVARRAKKDPIASGGWSMFATQGIALDYLDPFSVLLTGSGSGGWVGWVDQPKIEELKRKFASESDIERRKAIAREIQELAFDVVSYVPLGMTYPPIAHRKNVKGIIRSPLNLYWNISVN